ncbi:hypothetical protein CDAR_284171 [Caerostris darwini]|uniref:Uncharacterized protein n=1 Tax=Caerostris darwini TaxID=1538125 RepID=A0AAV4VI37_9ARAC|nr:hypothetical protein CDAR_284171 [Caerostris darwini]
MLSSNYLYNLTVLRKLSCKLPCIFALQCLRSSSSAKPMTTQRFSWDIRVSEGCGASIHKRPFVTLLSQQRIMSAISGSQIFHHVISPSPLRKYRSPIKKTPPPFSLYVKLL